MGVFSIICALICILWASPGVNAIDEIKIGVLMKHRGLEEPLNRTLEMLNADTSVLFTTRLVALAEVIETENSYQASAASKYRQTYNKPKSNSRDCRLINVIYDPLKNF